MNEYHIIYMKILPHFSSSHLISVIICVCVCICVSMYIVCGMGWEGMHNMCVNVEARG